MHAKKNLSITYHHILSIYSYQLQTIQFKEKWANRKNKIHWMMDLFFGKLNTVTRKQFNQQTNNKFELNPKISKNPSCS